jgi:hypothetical protein
MIGTPSPSLARLGGGGSNLGPALPAYQIRPPFTFYADGSAVRLYRGGRVGPHLHKVRHLAGVGAAGNSTSGQAQGVEQVQLGRIRVPHEFAAPAWGEESKVGPAGSTYCWPVECRQRGQSVTDPTVHVTYREVWHDYADGGDDNPRTDSEGYGAFAEAVGRELVWPQGAPVRLVRAAVEELLGRMARLRRGSPGHPLAKEIALIPWSHLSEGQRAALAQLGVVRLGTKAPEASAPEAPAPEAQPRRRRESAAQRPPADVLGGSSELP